VAEGDDIDMAQPTAFGTLLKDFRRRAGLTQEALAECANVSSQTITKLERGVYCTPHMDTVHLLAGALSLSTAEHDGLVVSARHPHPTRLREGQPILASSQPPHLSAFIQALNDLHALQTATLIDVFMSAHPEPDQRTQAAR